MHELSIAEDLLSIALDAVQQGADLEALSDSIIEEVHLRVGLLAGVEKETLHFCYDVVTEGTPLAGSRLVIQDVPVVIFCASCEAERELPGTQSFLCPICGRPSSDVRQGRELELMSIRLSDQSTRQAD